MRIEITNIIKLFYSIFNFFHCYYNLYSSSNTSLETADVCYHYCLLLPQILLIYLYCTATTDFIIDLTCFACTFGYYLKSFHLCQGKTQVYYVSLHSLKYFPNQIAKSWSSLKNVYAHLCSCFSSQNIRSNIGFSEGF